jgi:predicted nucleic acid-binding protein
MSTAASTRGGSKLPAEHDSAVAAELMKSDPVLVTSRLTEVEVRRNLARLLDGEELDTQRQAFAVDLDAFALVSLDATTMSAAAMIAEQTFCRALDSIHLGAARRAGSATTLLTFDVRQARTAHQIGIDVVGA